jgi:hypothetical protein
MFLIVHSTLKKSILPPDVIIQVHRSSIFGIPRILIGITLRLIGRVDVVDGALSLSRSVNVVAGTLLILRSRNRDAVGIVMRVEFAHPGFRIVKDPKATKQEDPRYQEDHPDCKT